MNVLKTGQVWRRNGSTYGDIDSWQVTQVGKRVAVVINCATNKEAVVLLDQESTFTTDNQLISDSPRWAEYVKES